MSRLLEEDPALIHAPDVIGRSPLMMSALRGHAVSPSPSIHTSLSLSHVSTHPPTHPPTHSNPPITQ